MKTAGSCCLFRKGETVQSASVWKRPWGEGRRDFVIYQSTRLSRYQLSIRTGNTCILTRSSWKSLVILSKTYLLAESGSNWPFRSRSTEEKRLPLGRKMWRKSAREWQGHALTK